MKKTNKQKRLEWKHIYANHFNKPYMLKINRLMNRKKGKRFKLDRLVKTVRRIKADFKEPFFSGCTTISKGVCIDSANMKVRILTSFN